MQPMPGSALWVSLSQVAPNCSWELEAEGSHAGGCRLGSGWVYNNEVMSTIEDLIRRAKRLPADERHRLIRQLQVSLAKPAPRKPPKRKRRGPAPKGLATFLALSGSAHSDYTDVSRNKGKHLADVYAPRR